MFDCYHMQIQGGDLLRRFQAHAARIGHIQIASVPDRSEPDTGEVAYERLLPAMVESGYAGWFGAEYRPRGRTTEGLGWLPHFLRREGIGRTRDADRGAARLPGRPKSDIAKRQDRVQEVGVVKVTYQIVRHDDGWAYKLGDVFSEAFPSHDAALEAARMAAAEQRAPGETTTISWEDEQGRWHEERSAGNDRPETEVEG